MIPNITWNSFFAQFEKDNQKHQPKKEWLGWNKQAKAVSIFFNVYGQWSQKNQTQKNGFGVINSAVNSK
jgi:hypothetical protein